MFNIIPIVLALLALAAILFVIIRKFPDIAVMDIEEIPKEQQGEVKKQILETRIERKFKDRFADVTAKFVQKKEKVKESIDTAKEKLQKMEAEYKKKSEPEIEKKGTFASPAMAFANKVFPVPGGPINKAPLGILPPNRVYF